jgi:hypothetical protein
MNPYDPYVHASQLIPGKVYYQRNQVDQTETGPYLVIISVDKSLQLAEMSTGIVSEAYYNCSFRQEDK